MLVAKLRHRPFQNTAFYRAALVALSPTAPVARSTSRGTREFLVGCFSSVNIHYTTMPNYDSAFSLTPPAVSAPSKRRFGERRPSQGLFCENPMLGEDSCGLNAIILLQNPPNLHGQYQAALSGQRHQKRVGSLRHAFRRLVWP